MRNILKTLPQQRVIEMLVIISRQTQPFQSGCSSMHRVPNVIVTEWKRIFRLSITERMTSTQ